jgi:flagellar biosynthesis/type III secretory pathway protein FliH
MIDVPTTPEEDEAFNEIERQAQQRKEAVKAAVHTLTEYQRGYEDGFVGGVQKQTESAVTKMMNGGIRNNTIEEVAQHVEKMTGFGQDTISSFAIYIRGMK